MPNNAKVTLIGNLTKDPTERTVGANKVVVFTVAVNTLSKKSDGSYDTNFYDVSVWGKSGEYVLEHFQKGTLVWVNGDLSMAEYVTKDTQQTRQALRVRADDVRGITRMKGDVGAKSAPVKATEDVQLPF